MRRFASLSIAAVTTLALATPALVSTATSASAAPVTSVSTTDAAKAKAGKIKIKRSSKGVQPGIGKMKLTALVKGKGKVKFVVKGDAAKVKKAVKIKNGRAVYKVPPLGTGKYKVTASFKGKKGKTKFEVYDSLLTVNSTTFTYSAAADCFRAPALSGSIRFKGKPATEGYADIYQDGKIKGGSSSPSFLGFTSLNSDGTFSDSSFICDVIKGSGNLGPKGPGTYFFNVYYTDGPEYSDYISSNTITVNVTP
ncbi:hypothetical protein [Nocardioides flavescens]|uniref:Ig-like domain (Group 3) n=1 Tax=Nocardioides flavescens TaxID=2691959 RepID=A0A6L7EYI0_9ACTN|nr:hypothetical protein [Nocardioides flavescens]MXG89465.1 hypothetical protein [Nocardioides flavescens]